MTEKDNTIKRARRYIRRRRRVRWFLVALLLIAAGFLIWILLKDKIRRKSVPEVPEDAVTSEYEAPDSGSEDSGDGSDTSVPEGAGSEAENAESASSGENAEGSEDASAASEPEKELIAAEQLPPERKIKISAAGDCTLGNDPYLNFNLSFNDMYREVGDPSYFFANVQDAFTNDDLTIINFEGTLTESTNRADKTYAFKGPPEYSKIVSGSSIEACNLANNHSRDFGKSSLEDTIINLERDGVVTFGYEDSKVITVNDIKVGLVGILELFTEWDAESDMLEQIEAVKEMGADLIIVTMHWGTELQRYPEEVQQYLGHVAIDHGAHLVIGHHPHVLQGIEVYKGRYIVYSLGNFCFGGNTNPKDKDTMIFQQTFTVDFENGKGSVREDADVNIVPCSISGHSGYNDFQPRILEGEEAERVLAKIEELSAPLG